MTDINLFELELEKDDDDPPGYGAHYKRVAPLIGGSKLALNVFELPPGDSVCPYHYECGEEEWLIVLTGTPTVRTPDGERELVPWDCAFFPAGETGAHKVTNRSVAPARISSGRTAHRRERRSIPTRTRSAPGRPASSSGCRTPSTISRVSSDGR